MAEHHEEQEKAHYGEVFAALGAAILVVLSVIGFAHWLGRVLH